MAKQVKAPRPTEIEETFEDKLYKATPESIKDERDAEIAQLKEKLEDTKRELAFHAGVVSRNA